MRDLSTLQPIDYLMIGHITQDLTPQGPALGGTASYASLTARSFGLRVGIVTSCRSDLNLDIFAGTTVLRKDAEQNSTFINTHTPTGRIQHIKGVAETITLADIPAVWRDAPIVHLGPIAHEISDEIAEAFPKAIIGVTPQGWLRVWDQDGLVSYKRWEDAESVLNHASVVIMSIEDVQGDEDMVSEFAGLVPVLVVTEAAGGCRVYWNGDLRNIRPPHVVEVDPVGAGDIFATSFFIRYQATRDPWESARFATLLAANSVTRKTLAGVPTKEEINHFMTEIIEMKAL
ncbi:MAG: ribokinase [Chloroflexi bacterium HGW-Chloroflexi-5]|nr:MAG: ribokinase [Chloroflexi bacterium HGW-Chloroflexi-5]